MPDTTTAVEQRQSRAPAPLLQQIDQVMPQLERLGVQPDRFARVLLTECRNNERLLACTPDSFMAAAFHSAQLGLEPGPLQQVWFIPRRNKKRGVHEVQWMLGFRGMIELARRAGVIVTVGTVHTNDRFVEHKGTAPQLIHEPNHADPGEPYLWYAVAQWADGRTVHRVLTKAQVEERRKVSSTPYKPGSPWHDWYDAMARKTSVRALWGELPTDPVLQEAVRADEQVLTMPTVDGPARPAIAGSTVTDAPAVPAGETDPLDRASVHELRQACDDAGLPKDADRDTLVARIRAARDGTSGSSTSPEEDGDARPSAPSGPGAAGQGNPGEGRDASAVASAASSGPDRDVPPPPPPPEDEPDDTPSPAAQEPDPEGPMTEAQRKKLFALFGEHDISDEQRRAVVVGHYGVESMNDLTVGQAVKLIDLLESDGGPGRFVAAADEWLAAGEGSDEPPATDSAATVAADSGAGADGEVAPAPDEPAENMPADIPPAESDKRANIIPPDVTPPDEPADEGPSLAERAYERSQAASPIGQLKTRIFDHWRDLAVADPEAYQESIGRVTGIVGGRPVQVDWSSASELELRREADRLTRDVSMLKADGKVR